MMRTCTALLIVLTLFGSVAWAESWSGMVISTVETTVLASATGVLAELDLTIGEVVHEGDLIGYTDVSCVYATEDGTVSLVSSDEGDIVSGTVLEIAPVSRYRVVSTTSDAYSSPETCLVHGGETLYVRCTSDRSHLAIGFVTNVSGTSFDLFTTAGELYIGETVNLYRTPDYAYESKVGVGTVVETDLISYSAQGHLHTLRVQEGDRVERGQLLFTYASAASTQITVPVNGIVTQISTAPGSSVKQDQSLATLALLDSVRIQFSAPETMIYLIHPGDTMYYLRADDPTDTPRRATVTAISHTADGDTYNVWLLSEETDLPIGLTVTVVDDTVM